MKLVIPVGPESDPDVCGEGILRLINRNKRYGYSTYDTSLQWAEDTVTQKDSKFLRDFLKLDYDEVKRARKICDDYEGVEVYTYWDGDGTILIKVGGNLLVNRDCKKATGWEWWFPGPGDWEWSQ